MGDSFDALILGGGPAGSATALLLARAGWSVLVVERQRFPRRKVCGEYLSGTNRTLLAELGVLDEFLVAAGPDVKRVGLFAGSTEVIAELPRPSSGWGRALSRSRFDELLLNRAAAAGATIDQPNVAEAIERRGDTWHCRTRSGYHWRAPVVVAAHGSWDVGRLPTQAKRERQRPDDLFGFKARFRRLDLAAGLMPLLAFPGGYGGMVHTDDALVSLSCCVRRDCLSRLRTATHNEAGPVIQAHIEESCIGVRRAIAGAALEGQWLAAGPIRPGVRLRTPPGIFAVGNAAGEVHPVVAEGISMALQSSWLLTRRLIAWRIGNGRQADLPAVATDYSRAWRRAFGARLFAARAVARWAMSPAAIAISTPLIRCFPGLLTWGALASGKVTNVVRPNQRHIAAVSLLQ